MCQSVTLIVAFNYSNGELLAMVNAQQKDCHTL